MGRDWQIIWLTGIARERIDIDMAQKTAHPKNSMAEKLLMGGIAIMAMAIIVSLFSYFKPFTWEDVKSSASAIIHDIQEKQKEKKERQAELEQKALADKSIPQITLAADMGDTSNLSAEPVFPDQDSIYSCFLDTALGAMLYYNQGDSRWKAYLYGGTDPMGRYGCGPTCVAMIINSFGKNSVSPVEMADWAAQNGCFARNGGSYHCLIPDSLSAFGLNVESVAERTPEQAAKLLRSGHILVALMGKGSLTSNGHFIIIVQIKENGNVYIADPANYENTTKEWNLQQLMDELKQVYDNGGPLWAVSVK